MSTQIRPAPAVSGSASVLTGRTIAAVVFTLLAWASAFVAIR